MFPLSHIALLREAGLMGLIVPEEHGGLGGTLRDLAAATYAMGTACPSTALAYFFHNTSASRGNAPAPMAAHKVANALAAGCPTILKPSEYAPFGATRLAQVIDEALRAAGAPPALFQLVQGGAQVGAQVVGDPRIRAVSFTGGLAGGRAVAAACAYDIKPVQLELAGNNPLIVLPDADQEVAARAAAAPLTTLNGQWCRALGRLIGPAGRARGIVDAVLDRVSSLQPGDPADEATDYGPLIHSRHRAAVVKARDDLGGAVHKSGLSFLGGNFLAPALVTGADPARTRDEIFGPVAAVHDYTTVDEAIALANGTGHGLEGYVVGTDEEAALAVARQVRAGEVKVNGSSVMSLHLGTPRPAWGLSGTPKRALPRPCCSSPIPGSLGSRAASLCTAGHERRQNRLHDH